MENKEIMGVKLKGGSKLINIAYTS